MQKTLEQILQDVGALVDQDITTPTGSDLTTRRNYSNLALEEWANAYQWKQLRNILPLSYTVSGASIGLPANYKKLMSVVYDKSKDSDNTYPEIPPQARHEYGPTDKYVYVIGDDITGRSLQINPVPTSSFSGIVDIQIFPSAMSGLSDICGCPHPEFVVKRVGSYVLEARSDPRFPLMKADADKLLLRMIEEEDAPSLAMKNQIRGYNSRPNGFVIGE